ncbi:MAG TPA: hypothetical protein VGL66_14880 [Caulobacteraceae bacterium]|jgi:hypothetical protein
MRAIVVVFSAVLLVGAGTTAVGAEHAKLAPEILQSFAMRDHYGIPVPQGDQVIYVDSASAHHISEEFSVIAARQSDGHWHISVVGEEGPGLLNIPRRMTTHEERTLSDADGLRLDDLLTQRPLYREKVKPSSNLAVGAAFHTMEIDSPSGHMVIRWTGRLLGKAGAIADLVIGAG